MSPGALAVPLMTSAGCIGVMAAEIRHGREASESARALARIVAAQFATLVGLAPAQEPATPAVEPEASQATG
jgi:GAF domain-containing protein